MPIRTPHFGLEAFILGDVYLGVVDERRFRTIDTHMAFISDLIGPGRIDGWTLSIPSPLTLQVSSGWGIIDRLITRTFGDYQKSLLMNNDLYVWMRIRPGVIGQLSAFSNIGNVDYTDSTPPSQPVGLAVQSTSTDSITITWTAISDIDFDKYEIYKSLDNLTYDLLDTSTQSSYTDIGLSENTIYYYKIKAYDLSGNVSVFSSSLTAATARDTAAPSDPTSVRITNSNGSVHLTWNASPYGNAVLYRAYVVAVSDERVPFDSTIIFNVDSSKVDMTIRNLLNGTKYQIILKAVSSYEVESVGVVRLGAPQDIGGPIDVTDITVVDYEGQTGVSSNGMTLTWDSLGEEYVMFTGASEIRLEEYNPDGTVLTSDWIPTLAGITTRSLEVFPYQSNGQTFFKSISSRTTYYITIRNIDDLGNRSVGKRVKHFTKNFLSPSAVDQISVTERADGSLAVTWTNSLSIFANNIVTITRTRASNDSILFDEEKVGRATSFILDRSYVAPGDIFLFSVSCQDEFGNTSDPKETAFDIGILADIPKPPAPQQQIGYSGDGQNIITWSEPPVGNIQGYRIYRSLDRVSLQPSDFILLETVSSTTFSYTDYEVTNGTGYVYFVTTVDIYNQESLNPRDDRYLNYPLISLRSSSNSLLNGPTNLLAVRSGSNIELSWTPTGGQFDGYQIFRSIGNKYSFTLIATVDPSTTSYNDFSVLRKTGKVYYIVRKFRNEADLVFTETNTVVAQAIYLGLVTTVNGEATIDLTNVRNIKNLEDPIKEETAIRLAAHKHTWNSDLDDRRINLSDRLVVSDWTTSDNQVYTTETDISETTTYTIFLNGEEASILGMLISVNKTEGTVTFEQPLAATGFELDTSLTFPFTTPPVLTVEFDNIEETQGILPKNRLGDISAQQVGVGVFEKLQIPRLNHDGRKKEKLEPVKVSMLNVDGYRFAPVSSTETIGDAVVFYDIIQAANDSNLLVAGTSDGIYTSEDFGITWDRRFETITPVIKFFYSSKYDIYFAGTNRGILFGRGTIAGGFSIWQEIEGTENAKIIRDIVEDSNGNVYCSTDLGVYKLKKDIGQGSFLFQQLPIFGPRSSEAYAMVYDTLRDRLIVSNELGVFVTYNEGLHWSFSNEFTEQRPIQAFLQSNNTLFALTDFMLWRRGPSDTSFSRIGVFESASVSRKLSIWKDHIFVTTDAGLMSSVNSSHIYEDGIIAFELAFPNLRIQSSILPATSMNIIDNKLFVGTECKLFVSEKIGKIALQSQFDNQTIPTVYVNGEQQYIGYRFTTSSDRLRKFVCFDARKGATDIVTIANQYKKFTATYGGWADANFLSSVALFVDGIQINEISLTEKPVQDISDMTLPVYNDRNAHKAGADIAKAKLDIAKNNLLTVERDSSGQVTKLTGFTKDNVVSFLYHVERFLSQLYESARIVSTTDSQGNTVTIPFKVPDFRVLLLCSTQRSNTTKFGSFGDYKTWVSDTDNAQTAVVGSFGNDLTADGNLSPSLLGGSSDLGQTGGGGGIGGGSSIATSQSSTSSSSTASSSSSNSNSGDTSNSQSGEGLSGQFARGG